MIRETARRSQLLQARAIERPAARKRLAGRAAGSRDDRGRQVMPFDVIVFGERGGAPAPSHSEASS